MLPCLLGAGKYCVYMCQAFSVSVKEHFVTQLLLGTLTRYLVTVPMHEKMNGNMH